MGGAGYTRLWAGLDSGAAVSRWGPSPSRGGSWPVSAAIWGQDSAAEAPGCKPCPSVPALKGCWLRPAGLLPVTPSGTALRWAPARRIPSSSIRMEAQPPAGGRLRGTAPAGAPMARSPLVPEAFPNFREVAQPGIARLHSQAPRREQQGGPSWPGQSSPRESGASQAALWVARGDPTSGGP